MNSLLIASTIGNPNLSEIDELSLLLNLLLAVGLGFVIGFERKMRAKEAGIGTHIVVCVGAALMMIVSSYGFTGIYDKARIAAQIVSGVGFLGAGMIIYRKQGLHGLTTAAGIWVTAGIGMAAGAGMYVLATCTTLIVVLVQSIMHLPIKILKSKRVYRLLIRFIDVDDQTLDEIKEIFNVKSFKSLEMHKDGDSIICTATLNTTEEFASRALHNILQNYPCIQYIKRGDDE